MLNKIMYNFNNKSDQAFEVKIMYHDISSYQIDLSYSLHRIGIYLYTNRLPSLQTNPPLSTPHAPSVPPSLLPSQFPLLCRSAPQSRTAPPFSLRTKPPNSSQFVKLARASYSSMQRLTHSVESIIV